MNQYNIVLSVLIYFCLGWWFLFRGNWVQASFNRPSFWSQLFLQKHLKNSFLPITTHNRGLNEKKERARGLNQKKERAT